MSVMASDFIKRFTPTPFEITVELSGASIRLQTNCAAVADHLGRALTPRRASADAPDFFLKIVTEPEEELAFGPALGVHRLSRDGLSFIRLGHTSFLVCDRQAHQGISFVSESLVTDEKRFRQHFLPALISLLAEFIEVSS
jgi:hypothetical protein